MAFTRLAGAAIFTLGVATRVLGTGGGYDMAPLTLDHYLKQIPAKSISQVLEDSGAAPRLGTASVIDPKQLSADFAAGPSPKLVAEMDQLLEKARHNYAGPADVNLLQDLRDLATGSGTPVELKDYVDWRFAHRGLFIASTVDAWQKPKFDADAPTDIDTKIKDASPALLPHWLYLEGAYLYKNGDDTASESYFDRVLKEFPNDPRAETAFFMKARCRLSQSVSDDWNANPKKDAKELNSLRDQARDLFNAYLARYPQGRYRIDVIGWLGGTDYRAGNYAQALDSFIRQIETNNHPEDFRPAVVMIEKCLYHLRDANSVDIDEVAKHPAVALALTYFAVNTALTTEFHDESEIAAAQTWRHNLLPKLATAVLAHKDLYRGKLGQDRYLAILAHAASDNDHQDQALQLVRLNGSKTDSDDLAFVDALVLQRAQKGEEAVQAYRRFLAQFPSSPLARGAQYRLGLTLHDLKQDGPALLEFAALQSYHLPLHAQPLPAAAPADPQSMPSPPEAPAPAPEISALGIDYSGAPVEEIDQTIDALLNFAPIASLETALAGDDSARADFRRDLRSVLQERCLAREDYDGAARFADSPALKKQFTDLARQARQLLKAQGPAVARGDWQLADYWADRAKMLVTFPLDGIDARTYVFQDDNVVAGLRRKDNGLLLSFPSVEEELDRRNEQQHAIAWWNRTVEADHSGELAPQALWKAIVSQRKVVETSPYTQQRAIELNSVAETRKTYDRLVSDYPHSTEAQDLAVYWTFPVAADLKKDSNDYFPYGFFMAFPGIQPINLIRDGGEEWRKALSQGPQNLYYRPNDPWKSVCDDLAQLSDRSSAMDAPAFAAEVNRQLAAARALATGMEHTPVINCLEDLALLAQVPNLDPAIRQEYVDLCVHVAGSIGDAPTFDVVLAQPHLPSAADIADLAQKPGAQPILDFIDFLSVAETAGTDVPLPEPGQEKDGQSQTYDAHDYAKLAAQAGAFLKKYPKSPKREAAALLRLRGLVLVARPFLVQHSVDWPATNAWNGDNSPIGFTQGPLDQAAYESALKEFNAEFPHTVYADSILSIRADAALIGQQWGEALDALVALNDPQTKPEFQDQVAVELSIFFNHLDSTKLRHDVLKEILQRPAARDLLAAYLKVGGLPYLRDYLSDQLQKSATKGP
jgi:TolA-binding protein